MKEKTIRTQADLIFNLLRQDFKELESEDIVDILDYVFDTPEETLEKQKHLRQRINKVLSESLQYIPNTHLEKLRDFIIQIAIIDSRVDFYSYVKTIAPVVIPNEYRDGRHIQVICEQLQALYESYENPDVRTDRLQVFLPPRSMKSVLCSILFPSWILGRNPKYRILLIGSNSSTAIDVFGRPLKNLISSQEYQAIFPNTKIDPDVKSAQRFNTKDGGGFYCAGGGQGIAGRGGDFIICDDVINEQNAWSKVERNRINNNYVPGIRSRSQPGAAELIINTRWHLDDLSGFTQKMDGYIRPDGTPSRANCYRPWKIISIPAILNTESVDILKRRGDNDNLFVTGGSYWPEYKPILELQALKQNYKLTEPHKWEALYMQNPVPEEGNIVKFSDFKVWRNPKPPKVTQILVSVDTAYSEKERADFSAITVWGVFYETVDTVSGSQGIPHLVLLYSEKGKWNFHEFCEKMEWLRSESPWKPDYFLIEKASGSVVFIRELYRRHFPLYEYDPKGKKSERLQAASMIIKAGRVWVPLADPNEEGSKDLKEWAQEVVDEVCNFPSAPHDDLTDTVSMAIIWLRDNGKIHYEAYDYIDEDEEGDKKEYRGFSYWNAVAK